MAKIQKIIERKYVGVYFAVILDKRFSNTENRYNVSVRVTYNYERMYIPTGITMTEAEFCKAIKAGKGEWFDKKKDAEIVFDRVYSVAKAMIDSNLFSIKLLKEKIRGCADSNIESICKDKLEELNGSPKTNTLYKLAVSKFVSVCGNLQMNDVNVESINKYTSAMRDDGLTDTTISMYLRCIRSLCNLAIFKEKMNAANYPFSKSRYDRLVKIPKTINRADKFLTIEEINMIDRVEKKGNEDVYWDLFLFSYLAGGMNLADMAHIRYDTSYYDSKCKCITYVRKKTENTTINKETIQIPIIDRAASIMAKYSDTAKANSLIFPMLSSGKKSEVEIVKSLGQWNKMIGKTMKNLCSKAGICKYASMTYARHSFKTNLMRKGVPDRYTEMAMGHIQRDVGSFYVGGFTIDQMISFHELLLEE